MVLDPRRDDSKPFVALAFKLEVGYSQVKLASRGKTVTLHSSGLYCLLTSSMNLIEDFTVILLFLLRLITILEISEPPDS